MDNLDLIYNIQMRDMSLSKKYDWCGCGSSKAWIIGLVLAVLLVGGGLYYFLVVKRKNGRNNRLNEENGMALGQYGYSAHSTS